MREHFTFHISRDVVQSSPVSWKGTKYAAVRNRSLGIPPSTAKHARILELGKGHEGVIEGERDRDRKGPVQVQYSRSLNACPRRIQIYSLTLQYICLPLLLSTFCAS